MAAPTNFFPRYIDKPRLIGIFEMDEFFLCCGILFAIMACSLAIPNVSSLTVIITAIVCSVSTSVYYSKAKKNKPDGYTFQKLYRKGIISPTDQAHLAIKYPYLKKIGRVVPYGFTNVLYT